MNRKTKIKGITGSMSIVAMVPFMVGCDPFTTGATLFGSVFWLDIALTPVRSLLGSLALNIVNTF